METIHTNETSVKELCKKAFPGYAGRTFNICITSKPSGYTTDIENNQVPCPGYCVIKHSIFHGKCTGLTLYIHPENVSRDMLPGTIELTMHEKIVLAATRSLKSSYSGIKNYRFYSANQDTGITLDQWESAKTGLIDRKLLRKNGSITDSGKNAIGRTELYQLKDSTPQFSY